MLEDPTLLKGKDKKKKKEAKDPLETAIAREATKYAGMKSQLDDMLNEVNGVTDRKFDSSKPRRVGLGVRGLGSGGDLLIGNLIPANRAVLVLG